MYIYLLFCLSTYLSTCYLSINPPRLRERRRAVHAPLPAGEVQGVRGSHLYRRDCPRTPAPSQGKYLSIFLSIYQYKMSFYLNSNYIYLYSIYIFIFIDIYLFFIKKSSNLISLFFYLTLCLNQLKTVYINITSHYSVFSSRDIFMYYRRFFFT